MSLLNKGTIHSQNYLNLPLQSLTGTSAITILLQTSVGDSRSLWTFDVRACNLFKANTAEWTRVMKPLLIFLDSFAVRYEQLNIPFLPVKLGNKVYSRLYVKARWYMQCSWPELRVLVNHSALLLSKTCAQSLLSIANNCRSIIFWSL